MIAGAAPTAGGVALTTTPAISREVWVACPGTLAVFVGEVQCGARRRAAGLTATRTTRQGDRLTGDARHPGG
ncbi:hypothetical protein FHS43_002235 [Streptosporangium becharense]|nr:hypothetical protein [Streptosporangium becharense]